MIVQHAIFSDDRTYRYALFRQRDLQKSKNLAFVGLNPSTADENMDDPTIRRCIGFAKSWGFGGMTMLNLFAVRATDPKIMLAHAEPVGVDNDKFLNTFNYSAIGGRVVACWGANGGHLRRGETVTELLGRLQCFGTTKKGLPKHPLYLPKTAQLVDYNGV